MPWDSTNEKARFGIIRLMMPNNLSSQLWTAPSALPRVVAYPVFFLFLSGLTSISHLLEPSDLIRGVTSPSGIITHGPRLTVLSRLSELIHISYTRPKALVVLTSFFVSRLLPHTISQNNIKHTEKSSSVQCTLILPGSVVQSCRNEAQFYNCSPCRARQPTSTCCFYIFTSKTAVDPPSGEVALPQLMAERG